MSERPPTFHEKFLSNYGLAVHLRPDALAILDSYDEHVGRKATGDESGETVASRLGQHIITAIQSLSAAGGAEDAVMALWMKTADDYVVYPFHPRTHEAAEVYVTEICKRFEEEPIAEDAVAVLRAGFLPLVDAILGLEEKAADHAAQLRSSDGAIETYREKFVDLLSLLRTGRTEDMNASERASYFEIVDATLTAEENLRLLKLREERDLKEDAEILEGDKRAEAEEIAGEESAENSGEEE